MWCWWIGSTIARVRLRGVPLGPELGYPVVLLPVLHNWVVIELTRGSAGLQSDNKEQIYNKIFDMGRAGDHLSFKMSKQMTPCELTLQW